MDTRRALGRLQLESQAFRLHRCAGDVLRLLSSEARAKGLELVGYVDPRLAELVRDDLARMRQVIANLAGNAFTVAGEVGVEVRTAPRVAARQRGGHA